MTEKKSKHFCSLLLNKKAQLPNMARKLQNEYNFTSAQLKQIFNLPHQVALEPYVKAFQYKVLNFILYTNTKLNKIGYSTDDKCTFCKLERETLHHLLFSCPTLGLSGIVLKHSGFHLLKKNFTSHCKMLWLVF